MCKAKAPKYTPPATPAKVRQPDEGALMDEAMLRAASKGAGNKRSTILTGQGGAEGELVLGTQGVLGGEGTVLGMRGAYGSAGRPGEAAPNVAAPWRPDFSPVKKTATPTKATPKSLYQIRMEQVDAWRKQSERGK